MNKNPEQSHASQHGRGIAYHVNWDFRKEAAVWKSGRPCATNFYPFGSELRKWMLQKPSILGLFVAGETEITNPYTFDASVLIAIFREVINDGAAFQGETKFRNSDDAEIRRIRVHGEAVLYTARVCEVLIKQLLFCTTIPEAEYKGATLRSLLSTQCTVCKTPKEKQHKISLLGSLAHHYDLCLAYENCLDRHLRLVAQRRNLIATHSGVSQFSSKSIDVLRAQFSKEFNEVGEDLIHMLQHLGDIEQRMVNEINGII